MLSQPTISYRWLSPAVATLSKQGADIGRLFALAGISRKDLNTDHRMAWASCDAVCKTIRGELEGTEIWSQSTWMIESNSFGLLSYLPSTSDTLGSALAEGCRYSATHSDIRIFEIHVEEEVTSVELTSSMMRQSRDFQVFGLCSVAVSILRMLGERSSFTSAEFTGRPPASTESLERIFGAIPRFGSIRTCFCFPTELLKEPLISADPWLHQVLLDKANLEVGNYQRTKSLARHLEVCLTNSDLRQVSLSRSAQGLGISKRSLQRSLAEESTTFREVLDAARGQQAIELFTRHGKSLRQAATLLGFSSMAAFHSAFKRATGTSPGLYRRSALLHGLGA